MPPSPSRPPAILFQLSATVSVSASRESGPSTGLDGPGCSPASSPQADAQARPPSRSALSRCQPTPGTSAGPGPGARDEPPQPTPAWLPTPTARHYRAAARAPASRRRRPHRSAASRDVDLAEALRAELMERFRIDARRIRAEGRPTPAPRPPRSPARASSGSMPRPGPSRRALHLRHQRQRQAVPRPSTTADRADFQLRALADGPERRVMREGRLQIDLDPNDAYRRHCARLISLFLSRSATGSGARMPAKLVPAGFPGRIDRPVRSPDTRGHGLG